MRIFKGLLGGHKKAVGASAEQPKEECLLGSQMREAILRWGEMYSNNAVWAHSGEGGLNIAATISRELARLVTMELKISVEKPERFAAVSEGLEGVRADLRRYTEYACAKGGLVFKPYVRDGKILVNYVQAEDFLPMQYDSEGHINGAVFTERLRRGGYIYTRLEKHGFDGDIYFIRNSAYRSKMPGALGTQIPLSDVDEWRDLDEECGICNLEKPLFAYFKMPFANTIDPYSPIGVSAFAGAEGLIRDADRQYARLLWEFESGERALYLDSAAYRRDEKGRIILPDKRLYRSADTGVDGLFEEWSPQLRDQSILNGLDAILMRIEDVCGLAEGTLSNVRVSAKTATELRMLRQKSYATVADIQGALESALRDLVYAMCVWGGLYGLNRHGICNVGFEFDDSILADRTREFDERERMLDRNVITAEEFRQWYMGTLK